MIKDQYTNNMPIEEKCPDCGERMRRLRSPEGKEWLYCNCWGNVGDCQTHSRKCNPPFAEKTEQ